MRKWTYLVAALLMAGATTTFTGCIDNDEPAGIENLRGAKAELLKAKAAVELANEAMVRAKVANQDLLNKAQEISNKQQEIALEMDKLDLAIKESSSAAEIAKYKLQLQQYENQKALEAEKFKATMLEAQTATAWAQKQYDDALAAIEAAKLMLSDEELMVVEYAQKRVETKAAALATAHTALNAAANALNSAYETTVVTDTKEGLENEIAKKQVALDVAKTAQSIVEELIAKNIDTFAGWEKEVKELETKIGIQDTIIAQAKIDKKKIEESEAGKAAKKAVEDATAAEAKAKTAYEDAYGSGDASKIMKLSIAKFSKSVAANKAMVEVLNQTNVSNPDVELLPITAYANGVFSYAKGEYNQKAYDDDKKNETSLSDAVKAENAVAGMIALVNAVPGRAAEDLAWVNLTLTKKEKIAKDASEAYDIAVKEWEKAVTDYKEGKNYTETEYNLAVSKITGLLTDIKDGVYNAGSMTDAMRTAAFNDYVTFRATMAANGQTNQPATLTAKNFAELKTALAGGVTGFVPTGYTAVDENTRKNALMAKSEAAFGTLYMFNAEPRITLPTASEIAKEQAKVGKNGVTYASYKAIGATWEANDEVTYYKNIIAEAENIKTLKAELVAQQTVLNAEIAANAAKIAEVKLVWTNAKADTETAKTAEKALYVDVNAKNDKASELKGSYEAIKDVIVDELEGIAEGATTVADVKAALANKLNDAKTAVITAEVALKDAKTKLEHFEAGKYDKKYQIEVLTAELERAQARFNEAQSVYEKALADLNAIIAKLVK